MSQLTGLALHFGEQNLCILSKPKTCATYQTSKRFCLGFRVQLKYLAKKETLNPKPTLLYGNFQPTCRPSHAGYTAGTSKDRRLGAED